MRKDRLLDILSSSKMLLADQRDEYDRRLVPIALESVENDYKMLVKNGKTDNDNPFIEAASNDHIIEEGEYAVDEIDRHTVEGSRRLYRIRWYGYT